MIIFLYGKDDFRSLQKLKQIINAYQKTHKTGLNLKFFDCKKQDFQELKNQFYTKSMFKEKKLFIVKNAFTNPDFKQNFLKLKKEFIISKNIIVFYAKGDCAKSAFFNFLIKNSKSQKFNPLKTQQLEKWIKQQLIKYQTEIKPDALKLLIGRVGNNLWQISNEIQKLVNFKNGKIITKQDIKNLVSQKIELNIFKTIDAIAEKNKQKALFLIHQHLEKGDSALYLLSMIGFQFRNLLMVKTRSKSANNIRMLRMNELSKELGMHPFVFRKSLWLSQKFSLQQLKKIYQKIFQIDLDIKTGKIQPELALDLLVAQL